MAGKRNVKTGMEGWKAEADHEQERVRIQPREAKKSKGGEELRGHRRPHPSATTEEMN